jgi:uncharacterized membrane protein (UPF0136 family)
MADLAPYSILVLSIIMLLGGVMGFVKGKSKPSLIAGVVSSILLGICFYLTTTALTTGLIGALLVSAALDLVFAMRLKKTGKFMPSGMLLLIVVLFQGLIVVGLLQSSPLH